MFYLTICFKKMFCAPLFWVSIAAIAVICMFSPLYDNPQTGVSENILYVYLHYSKEALLQDVQLSAHAAFVKGLGGWLSLFIPVLTSLTAVNIRLDEYNSNMWRFVKLRTGKRNYNISSCIFYYLSGGITASAGYLLFGICVCAMFPGLSLYQAEDTAFYLETIFRNGSFMERIYECGGLPLAIGMQFIQIFLYGASCTMASLFLTSFVENKYIIICTPFFLKYTLNRLSANLISAAYDDWEHPDEMLGRLADIINPETIATVLYYNGNVQAVLILHVFVTGLSFLCFCMICNRRDQYVT